MNEGNLEITNKTKGKLPSLPFVDIKNEVLGADYELSLVFVGDTTSKKLNFSYRGKNKPTNVLSFPLDEHSGEIFINPKKALEEAKEWDKTFEDFIGLLYVHGLYHLKGHDHSDEMDRLEEETRKKFNL
ncbi:MAG: hypothetical protein RJA61_102 [Candidatus Parcubacteria bacterium]|jgi:probable rRNA maturation factor